MSESKRPDPKSVIWELQDKFYEEECTLLEALSQAFDFGKHASSTPEPAVDVACKALARAMGLPADHPQGSNIAWLAGRAVALLEPAVADREALDIELEADRFLGRYGEPFTEWQRKDLYALLRDVAAKSAAEALVAASPDRHPMPIPGNPGWFSLEKNSTCSELSPEVSYSSAGAPGEQEGGVAPNRATSGLYPSHPAEVAAPPGEQWVADVLDVGTGPDGKCEVVLRCSREQAHQWAKLLYTTVTVVPAPPKGTP